MPILPNSQQVCFLTEKEVLLLYCTILSDCTFPSLFLILFSHHLCFVPYLVIEHLYICCKEVHQVTLHSSGVALYLTSAKYGSSLASSIFASKFFRVRNPHSANLLIWGCLGQDVWWWKLSILANSRISYYSPWNSMTCKYKFNVPDNCCYCGIF